MFSVFSNKLLQKEFEQKGYIIAPAVLSAEDIAALKNLFVENLTQYQQPFHASHFSTDKEYKQQVHEAVSGVVFPRVQHLLHNFKPVFGNYMVKQPDPATFLQMHADWAYVEESEYRSVAVWIPLVDTDLTNGSLGVIEGSHLFMNRIRGPRIQQNSFTHDRQWVQQYGKLLPVKAGDAIIYDHALLHFSPANTSGSIRPALNLSLVPRDVQMIHYCIPEGADAIQKYHAFDDSFFIQYDNFQTPEKGELVATLPADTIQYIDGKMKWLWLRRLLGKIGFPLSG